VSHRLLVIQHRPELMTPEIDGPSAVWYDADQHDAAMSFAVRVSRVEQRHVRVQTVEMGVCGCGPPSVTDGDVTIWADAWGECMSAAGPDCGCICHWLEGVAASVTV